jgi:lysine-N-methylase
MQINDAALARYQKYAPQLLAAVDLLPQGNRLRRDPESDFCVKFESGLCGIQREYGEDFLGDACHFYPRSLRRLGDELLMSATFSCPEVARLALADADAFAYAPHDFERVTERLVNYQPSGMIEGDAPRIMAIFSDWVAAQSSLRQALPVFASAARSLDHLPPQEWLEALPSLLKTAEQRSVKPLVDIANPHKLLHLLVVTLLALQHRPSERLMKLLGVVIAGLEAEVDWESAAVHSYAPPQAIHDALSAQWQQHGAMIEPWLKRWFLGQISLHIFPFAGLGETPSERAMLLLVRYSLMRTCLLAWAQFHGTITQEDGVFVLQTLARVLDHIPDGAVLLTLSREKGWDKEEALAGLL